MDTLVLSHTYQPIKLVNWFDAFNMVLTGRAELIAAYENKEVYSFTRSYKMPSVIRFIHSVVNRFANISYVKISRKNVWARDNGVCQYCGKHLNIKDATLDHVIPRSMGGQKVWTNIVLSCYGCNQKKGNKPLHETNLALKSKPCKPKNIEISRILAKNKEAQKIWKIFLEHYIT